MSEVEVLACDKDNWGEVINGDGTYKWIADVLSVKGAAIIGWTDQQGTHLDILFSVPVAFEGTLQGGVRPGHDLFVSVMRKGAFAFDLGKDDTHHGYIAGKLDLPACVTTEALADLINNVRHQYVKE